MKFTVSTISYNQAKFLRECIDSVVHQKSKNFEIEYFIQDPGSGDGSREIINEYAGQIFALYEADNGPADGLNRTLRHATGDVFCYVNSDDYLLPGALERVHQFFETNPNVDVVTGDGLVVDRNSRVRRRVFSDPFNLRAVAHGACVSIQPSTFFRMEYVSRVGGFNAANRSNWDGELLVDVALAGAKVAVLRDFLSAYRVYGESITGSGKFLRLHDEYQKRIYRKILNEDWSAGAERRAKLFRIRKHLSNPRGFWERIIHGPIFGQNYD